MFIHGIGIGLFPYVKFLIDLSKIEGVGIIVLELMPISSRICPAALSADRMREDIRKVVQAHGWDEGFVLVGHSYVLSVVTADFR